MPRKITPQAVLLLLRGISCQVCRSRGLDAAGVVETPMGSPCHQADGFGFAKQNKILQFLLQHLWGAPDELGEARCGCNPLGCFKVAEEMTFPGHS